MAASGAQPDRRPEIEILLEDPHLLVVNKPQGLLVVPAPGRGTATVLELLGQRRGERLYPVHRLDEETSGVLVLARSQEAQTALEQHVFRPHAAVRVYLALVSRVPSPPAGRIRSRLTESEGRMRTVTSGGELAITHYKTLARRGSYALVQVELETGRRNQIRAHMADLGCPVVGDRKYGFRRRGAGPASRVSATMLHAWRIEFLHPITGSDVSVSALPPEMLAP